MSALPFMKPHDCGDSRLSCTECSGKICPKCMVQCAVGFRCNKCSAKFASHAIKVTPAILVKTGLAAVVFGYVFGMIDDGIGFGLWTWIVLYVVSLMLGKVLHRVAHHKLGKTIVVTVIGALLVGIILSPARDSLLTNLSYMISPPAAAQDGTSSFFANSFLSQLASIGIFIAGIISPFMLKNS